MKSFRNSAPRRSGSDACGLFIFVFNPWAVSSCISTASLLQGLDCTPHPDDHLPQPEISSLRLEVSSNLAFLGITSCNAFGKRIRTSPLPACRSPGGKWQVMGACFFYLF